MPPKRKGRQTNNKKKNRGAAARGGTNPSASSSRQTQSAANVTANGPSIHGTAPDLSDFERRSPIHQDYPTVYRRYKDATQRFFDYMKKQGIPEGCGTTAVSVNTLILIADGMHEEGRTIDPMALKDLKLSIRMRSRVARSVFGGGDSGHQHLLAVLIYCFTVLVTLPRAAVAVGRAAPNYEYDEGGSAQENRFAAFQNDIDDDEDEDLDETIFPTAPVTRPEPEPDPMSLEHLMKSDERNDCILFFLFLEEVMDIVVEQYQVIVKNHRNNRKKGYPESKIVEEMIEAAVATNMSIQHVHRLEMDLQLQYPHLTTPYRVLSTVVLPEFTNEVSRILREHASSVKHTVKDIIIFLGDCLECAFRNKTDPLNRSKTIVQEFCAEFQVDPQGSQELEKKLKYILSITRLQVPIAEEKNLNAELVAAIRLHSPSYESHSWLNMPHIGRRRAIYHTIRLLQAFGHIVKDTPANRIITARPGYFGPSPWVPGRSSRISGDLDELLMADILPRFVMMYRHGILGIAELPMMDEIAPLWVNIRSYIRSPEKPVSWSLAFSIHAMLTAILETDQITDPLMTISENVFANFIDQVKWAKMVVEEEPDSSNNSAYHHIIDAVVFLENLGLPIFGRRAIWNPLCAGTTFSYLALFGSLEAGSALLNNRAQLRIVMYLFHGLLLNGIVRKGQIPFLDVMYDSFISSRAMWGDALPRRGELVQRFWTCIGMNLSYSRTMAQQAQEMYSQMGSGRETKESSRRDRSKKNNIKPEEISTSYRRICNRDFRGVVDKYHTPEQRERTKGSDFYMLCVRVNDTLDAIDQEQNLLSFNLASCGAILEQFVCSLARVMQWDPIIKAALRDNPLIQGDQRQGVVRMFAQHLLGALDFATDPMYHNFLDVPLGLASSEFLTTYFTGFNHASKAKWFQAVIYED